MANAPREYKLTLILDPQDLADLLGGEVTIRLTARNVERVPEHGDAPILRRCFAESFSAAQTGRIVGMPTATVQRRWKELGLPTHLHPAWRKKRKDKHGLPLSDEVLDNPY